MKKTLVGLLICVMPLNTLTNFVEASLKEHISPDIEVVEV